MCLDIYFSEKCDLDGVLDAVWGDKVRSSWLILYACLYTTSRESIRLC